MDYSSQTDYYDPNMHQGKVVVVGAGGIGSPTILGLARLGIPKLQVWDDDIVELRNITNQSYVDYDISEEKAQAISDHAKSVSDHLDIDTQCRRVDDTTLFTGDIVVSAVDSMKSRRIIFDAVKRSPSIKYLIDGRLGGQLIQCYNINMRDKKHVDWYSSEDVLFTDSEMVSQACTARTIYDVSLGVSALIVRTVRQILTGNIVEKLLMLNMETLRLDKYGE
jgi:adenylyltransferase/sulfurtransferase